MDFRSLASYLGLILEIFGILTLFPLVVSWVFQEPVFIPFLLAAAVSFFFGFILERKFRRSPLSLGQAMLLSALTFLIISFFGAVPYLDHMGPVDAVFESVSGFTTTGLSVVNPETLPNSILFWRSFTQWIGGVGILVIFLLLLSSPGMSSYYIYKAEGRSQRIEAGIYHTVKKIMIIYGIYTLMGFILLVAAGMPVFDSILHTFTSLSTGGFSNMNASIGAYSSPGIEIVIIILMILGGTSFFVHDKIFRKKFLEYLKNSETKLFWIIGFVFSLFLSISFIYHSDSIRIGVFHAFSALTTTGFTTIGMDMPGTAKILIVILMVIGGFAGSTAGGLKLVRVGILARAIPWLSRKITYPMSAVLPFKFHGKAIRQEELTIISLFSFLYIVILVVSTLAFSAMGYTPIDSLYVSASAEGTVGLSTIDISLVPVTGKVMLMVLMLLGRLEILPFLVLIYTLAKSVGRRK
ncbi:MAG: TrkH family potassium uptake protein [Candidatus Aenigmarchaeota archaeon]|nr:TrkH family potassium uptake protein [Candidatus Aenigmarchaeota archaeon]